MASVTFSLLRIHLRPNECVPFIRIYGAYYLLLRKRFDEVLEKYDFREPSVVRGSHRYPLSTSETSASFAKLSALPFSRLAAAGPHRTAYCSSFLEEQFPGAECSFDDCLDERDTQLPFFEFQDTVNRAAGRCRHRVFQQRWMVSRLQYHAR